MGIQLFHFLKTKPISPISTLLKFNFKETKMKIFLLSFFLFLLALQSCTVGTTGTWKNDRIDPEIKNQIAVLNKKLFKSLVAADVAGAKKLMAPVLIENSEKEIGAIISAFNENYKNTDYQVLDEYYTKNSVKNVTNVLLSARGDASDYKIAYLALNEEMYVSVLVSKNLPVNFMIMAAYGKYNDGWKLNILQVGNYSILDKNATDFYKSALEQYKQGNLANAADQIIVASEIAHPAESHFSFNSDSKMQAFYSKVLKEVANKYKFPLALKNIKTEPSIFSINPQVLTVGTVKGVFPMVKYQSKIQLSDTIALKAENIEIQKSIADKINGLNKDNAYVFYQAFNQTPNGKTPVQHYGFVQRIGK